ncbi:hypothetical protein ACSFBM_00105 [Variovorax sp. GB1R11]|uniref:hypothetical protein n=1 Tax=Variovorax sp. GB1R11 TaxID=3443741 RepID=UPI003F46163F
MARLKLVLYTAVLAAASGAAQAQSSDEMNAANNPLAPKAGLSLQDQYTDSLYGLDAKHGNAALLRGTLPHRLFGMPQIFRATLPFVSTPDLFRNGRRHTGLGDLNLFNIFVFKAGGIELGIGPQLTVPTASRDETGTGKWQAGVAAIALAPQKWGLAGGLFTWQTSFAGSRDRTSVNSASVQPIVIYNLPEGWYLRSSATWNFNLKNGDYVIPIGLGAGKIWKSGNTTYNLFVEPQWTAAHQGNGQPKFQVYLGLNLQFPL